MIAAGDPRPIEQVIDRVLAHVRAEFTSDPDIIAGTISADAFFPVLVRGAGKVDFFVLTEAADIHDYYAARVGTFEILDSNRVCELRSDWYALHETVSRVRHVGEFNGIPGSGRTFRVHSTVLFPTDSDGIVGELEWTRFDFADIFTESVTVPPQPSGPESYLPLGRVAAVAAHDRLMTALAAGDTDEVLAELTPECHWATRYALAASGLPATVQASGSEAIRAHLDGPWRSLAGRPFRLLSRYASEWFVFAEYAVDLPGQAGTARMASLWPFAADGRFSAQLGYAVTAGCDGP